MIWIQMISISIYFHLMIIQNEAKKLTIQVIYLTATLMYLDLQVQDTY